MIKDTSIPSRILDATLLIVILGAAILCILPIWYTLVVSLSQKSAVAAGLVQLWPVGFNFNSYREIMADGKFFLAFGVSTQRVLLGASLSFFVMVLTAYPLSKTARDFRFRNVFMWLLIFALLFNGGLIPWYLTIKSLHLIDSVWALVLGGGVPVFNVILVINFFRNLPKQLEEAALVDGAGPWYVLIRIFIPLSVPVLATVTLFTIVYHWNEFFQGLILMSNSDHYPLQTYIQQLVVSVNMAQITPDQYEKLSQLSNQTLNSAKVFVALIPILLIYPFLQRFFIHGITLGSVKE